MKMSVIILFHNKILLKQNISFFGVLRYVSLHDIDDIQYHMIKDKVWPWEREGPFKVALLHVKQH